jgi:hypothetical protein
LISFDSKKISLPPKKTSPPPWKAQELFSSLQKITRGAMRFNTKNLEVFPEFLERERESCVIGSYPAH